MTHRVTMKDLIRRYSREPGECWAGHVITQGGEIVGGHSENNAKMNES